MQGPDPVSPLGPARAVRVGPRVGTGPGTVAVRWAVFAAVLAVLAWQGHHLAHWLPQFEGVIERAGRGGPVVFCIAVVVLEPFLVPDTLFGVAAGAAFGVVAGITWYFTSVYVACLGVHWLGRHWLKARVLTWLEGRPRLRVVVERAPEGGARFAFLVRLVPLNPALVSYAMGAAGVSLRAAAVGNLGMLVHMLATVYFGAAAVRVTRMAARHHAPWEAEGLAFLLGLAVVGALALLLGRRAWAVVAREAHANGDTNPPGPPGAAPERP